MSEQGKVSQSLSKKKGRNQDQKPAGRRMSGAEGFKGESNRGRSRVENEEFQVARSRDAS